VILLCGYLVAALWGDVRYQLSSEDPTVYATAQELLSSGEADTFVQVSAIPIRTSGAKVRQSKGVDGHRLFPVAGTKGAVWVMTRSDHWLAVLSYDEVYRGRLYRFGDLPFADKLRDHVRDNPGQQPVDIRALHAAVDGKSSSVAVLGGDELAVDASTPLQLVEEISDRAVVTVVATDRWPDEATWRLTLKQMGLVIKDDRAFDAKDDRWRFEILDPGGVGAVRAKLTKEKLFAAEADAITNQHTTTWDKLSTSGQNLLVNGDPVSIDSVSYAALLVPHHLTDDTWVVAENDNPSAYYYAVPAVIVLLLFGLFFAALLILPLLRREQSIPST
jgi:hypothetical protein